MLKVCKLKAKFFLVILITFIAITINVSADTTRLTFATAGAGGTYYPMGIGVASFLTKNVPNIEVTCQTSGGSAENIRIQQNGEIDMSWANGSEIYWAWNKEEFFKDKHYDKIRIVSFAWTNTYHFLSLRDSQILSLNDFYGHKIGLGPHGSGAAIFGETFLRHIGLWENITPMFLPPEDQVMALKNNNIDVFGYFSGIPMASILDISATEEIQLIDLQEEGDKKKFTERYPFYIKTIIPKGTYKDQEEDIGSYSNLTYWIASEDLPEDLVYNMVKSLYSDEGIAYMKTVHRRANELSIDNMLKGVEELGVPLHPGVIKFLEEKGINTPKNN